MGLSYDFNLYLSVPRALPYPEYGTEKLHPELLSYPIEAYIMSPTI